jgi:hypothetical protein
MYAYVSPIRGAASSSPILAVFGKFGGLADVINCANFHNDQSKGFRSEGAQKLRSHRKAKSSLTLCLGAAAHARDEIGLNANWKM